MQTSEMLGMMPRLTAATSDKNNPGVEFGVGGATKTKDVVSLITQFNGSTVQRFHIIAYRALNAHLRIPQAVRRFPLEPSKDEREQGLHLCPATTPSQFAERQ